jgi:hypothetical protein
MAIVMIAASTCATATSGAAANSLQNNTVRFELRAEVAITPFSAKRSADHPPGNIVARQWLPDGFNPWFGSLKVDLSGGQSDIEAKLVGDLYLSNGISQIPMIVVGMSRTLKTYEPVLVAYAHELGQRVKTVAFTAKGIAHMRPAPGNYYGQLAILFEPMLPSFSAAKFDA